MCSQSLPSFWEIRLRGQSCAIRELVKYAALSPTLPYGKAIPIYHPAAILRDWSFRPVTVLDLTKTKREAAFREVRRPVREIYIEPLLEDMEQYYDEHLVRAERIAFDVETAGNQITCIGFSPNSRKRYRCPFCLTHEEVLEVTGLVLQLSATPGGGSLKCSICHVPKQPKTVCTISLSYGEPME